MDLFGKQASSIKKCRIVFVSSTDFACSVKDSHLPVFHPSAQRDEPFLGCRTSRRKVDDVEEIPPDMEKLAKSIRPVKLSKTGETPGFFLNLWLFFHNLI